MSDLDKPGVQMQDTVTKQNPVPGSAKSKIHVESVGMTNAHNFASPSKIRSKRVGSKPSIMALASSNPIAPSNHNPFTTAPRSEVAQPSPLTIPEVYTGANAEYITECATAWSVLGFLLSSFYAALKATWACTQDLKVMEFYSWI